MRINNLKSQLNSSFSPGIGVIDPCMISVFVLSVHFYLASNISTSLQWIKLKFWVMLENAIAHVKL